MTAGLRVEAGEVRIDDELILSVAANSSGVVRIDGGTVDVGGRVVFNGTVTDTTGGKVFLSGGRLVVVGPDRLVAGPLKQFYWEDGTLAFSRTDTTLTATQLQNYTQQGAISYGGERVAGPRSAGTLFHERRPRLVEISGIAIEAELGAHMLFVRNDDKPGFIGALGRLLGDAGINIATFHLGRAQPGGNAIALIEVDQPVPAEVLASICALPHTKQCKTLSF